MTLFPLRREVEPARRQPGPWIPIFVLGATGLLTLAMTIAAMAPRAERHSVCPVPRPAAIEAVPSEPAPPEPAITAAERERLVREAEALIRASRIDIARHEQWARENLEEVHVPCHPGQAVPLDGRPRAFEECVVMKRKRRP